MLLTERGAPLLRPMAPSGGDEEPWLLATDGGLRGDRGGIGMVLAKAGRILEVRGFVMRVHAGSSTAMEQLAKSTWIEMLDHLPGVKLVAADSSAGAFTGTRLPSYGTWLDDLIRGSSSSSSSATI